MKLHKIKALFDLTFTEIINLFSIEDFTVSHTDIKECSQGYFCNVTYTIKEEAITQLQLVGGEGGEIMRSIYHRFDYRGCRTKASKDNKKEIHKKLFEDSIEKRIESLVNNQVEAWNSSLKRLVVNHNTNTTRTIVSSLYPSNIELEECDTEFKSNFEELSAEIRKLQKKLKEFKTKKQKLFGDYIMTGLDDLESYPQDAQDAIKAKLFQVPTHINFGQ